MRSERRGRVGAKGSACGHPEAQDKRGAREDQGPPGLGQEEPAKRRRPEFDSEHEHRACREAKRDRQGAAGPQKGLLGKLRSEKMLLIAVPALLLVVRGGGAGDYFFLFKKSDTAQEAKAEEVPLTPPKVAFSDMQDILVNIQSNDGTPAYLKMGVSLELDDEEQKKAMEPLMPRITDQFQAYLRDLRRDDRTGSDGVLRLAATNGLDRRWIGKATLRVGEGITGWVANARGPLAVRGLRSDPRFKWVRSVRRARFP